MSAKIIKKSGNKITIEIDMDLNGSLLSQEQAIQLALNEAGKLATKTAVENFDTDGKPIEVRQQKLTSKGAKKK